MFITGYKVKYEECREQLDQLEGFKSQELAKVKHMLLKAEEALEAERSSKKDQMDDLVPVSDDPEQDFAKERGVRLKLEKKVESLEESVKDLQGKLTSVSNERDGIKTSLLEMEIASHEGNQAKEDVTKSLKGEIAKMKAEIETYKVTLDVRENEIKAKKEDFKREKSKNQEMEQSLQDKEARIHGLQQEVEQLKTSLNERLVHLRDSQKQSDELQIQAEALQSQIRDNLESLEQGCAEQRSLKGQIESLARDNLSLQEAINGLTHQAESLKDLLEAQKREYDQLEAKKHSQERVIDDLRLKCDHLERDKVEGSKELAALHESLPRRIESSDRVKGLCGQINGLETELEEKKQAVRHLQLRNNEMKKMLQKGIKPDVVQPTSFLMSASPTSELDKDAAGVLIGNDNGLVSEVTLKYVRHVIFKFLTSPEVEAKQMIRALATILHFSLDEEKTLQEYLDWKMSWFPLGAKPKLP